MRVIELCGAPIRALGVSPDGRFVAASADGGWLGTCDVLSGAVVRNRGAPAGCDQFAFAPDGGWVAYAQPSGLRFDRLTGAARVPPELPGSFAGGVAVSPDGKKLVAVQNTGPDEAKLAVWELSTLRLQVGYDGWAPLRRLALSRNGEFVAGIWPGARRRPRAAPAAFEMRFARSGGLDYTYPPLPGPVFDTPGFVSFTRDGATCAFGWEGEFQVLDLATGTARESKYVKASFRDGAFAGSGRHLATIDDGGVLKLWDARTWQVARAYDWRCGPLTCLAFTADGTAGVCGTADGRLVQFDVDE